MAQNFDVGGRAVARKTHSFCRRHHKIFIQQVFRVEMYKFQIQGKNFNSEFK